MSAVSSVSSSLCSRQLVRVFLAMTLLIGAASAFTYKKRLAGPVSPLTQQYLSEGVLDLDESGMPTTTCLARKKGEHTAHLKTCAQPKNRDPTGVIIGCMAVWNDEGFVMQDCWTNQDTKGLISRCTPKRCDATSEPVEGFSFCCCHGAECNSKYTPFPGGMLTAGLEIDE